MVKAVQLPCSIRGWVYVATAVLTPFEPQPVMNRLCGCSCSFPEGDTCVTAQLPHLSLQSFKTSFTLCDSSLRLLPNISMALNHRSKVPKLFPWPQDGIIESCHWRWVSQSGSEGVPQTAFSGILLLVAPTRNSWTWPPSWGCSPMLPQCLQTAEFIVFQQSFTESSSHVLPSSLKSETTFPCEGFFYPLLISLHKIFLPRHLISFIAPLWLNPRCFCQELGKMLSVIPSDICYTF